MFPRSAQCAAGSRCAAMVTGKTIRFARAPSFFSEPALLSRDRRSPGSQAVRAALEQFDAMALFDGERCPVHLRVAEHDGRLYLDPPATIAGGGGSTRRLACWSDRPPANSYRWRG